MSQWRRCDVHHVYSSIVDQAVHVGCSLQSNPLVHRSGYPFWILVPDNNRLNPGMMPPLGQHALPYAAKANEPDAMTFCHVWILTIVKVVH